MYTHTHTTHTYMLKHTSDHSTMLRRPTWRQHHSRRIRAYMYALHFTTYNRGAIGQGLWTLRYAGKVSFLCVYVCMYVCMYVFIEYAYMWMRLISRCTAKQLMLRVV